MSAPLARQLNPLRVDPRSGEVYLQLPPPHDNIIITPPRMSDAEAITQILNDPRVYMTLVGPPYPYLPEHAESWLASIKQGCDDVLASLDAAKENASVDERSPLPFVDGCPVRIIREVQPDGSEIFLGDVYISRSGRFDHLRDKDQEKVLVSQNLNFPVGSPKIIWDIGDYLAPSHHGRGVMSSALRTIIHEWAILRMNAHTIHGRAFKDNVGSVKVFLKNAFREFDLVEDCVTIAESKGGGTTGLHFLEWRRTV